MPTDVDPDPDLDLGIPRDYLVDGIPDDRQDEVLNYLVERGALVEHPDGSYGLNGWVRPVAVFGVVYLRLAARRVRAALPLA